jgi:hypothetical protein
MAVGHFDLACLLPESEEGLHPVGILKRVAIFILDLEHYDVAFIDISVLVSQVPPLVTCYGAMIFTT